MVESGNSAVNVIAPAQFKLFPAKALPPDLVTATRKDYSVGFYGPFDAGQLSKHAATLVSSNSDGNENLVREVIHEFLELAHQDCTACVSAAEARDAQHARSCWLIIRMTLPTDEWVVPRWHADGRMFDCSCPKPPGAHSKYAITILGPSTRVMKPDPAVTAVVNSTSQTGREWDFNDPDPELVRALAEFPEVTVQPGQVIRFSWGQHDSPVHSEPDSTAKHRIYASVLFGSEAELQDMCNFRGTNYGKWE